MEWMKRFVLILIIGFAQCEVEDENLMVTLENGILRGTKFDGINYGFFGIPYAEPPLGEQRFEPSTLYSQKWDGIRDASKPGSKCIQWDHLADGEDLLEGLEDCLFINVYTPNPRPETKLPVILYIHGGAFMFGEGYFYSPEKLLTKSFVAVTFNYRVGPLGFLSTEDETVPGNMGMKDQVIALKWVQKNIAKFGGDPTDITLTGYSAGGASVHLHYLSPLSKNLFKRGIAHSGTALNPWVIAEKSAEKAKRIATELDCPICCSKKMIKCLKEKPAEEIVRTVRLFLKFLYNPFSPFGVVVENVVNDGTFLSEAPEALLEKGEINKLPLIISVTEEDGLYPAAQFYSNSSYLEMINENWNDLIPVILDYKASVPAEQLKEISQKIRQEYFQDQPLNEETIPNFTRMITDRLFKSGITGTAKLQYPHAPVYFYVFRYSTKYSVSHYLSKSHKNYGICHGDDVTLIYKTFLRTSLNADEIVMTNHFLDLYDNFRLGAPAFGGNAMEAVDSADAIKFLAIKDLSENSINTSDNLGNIRFWKSLNLNE